jgi:hypothetical protein
MVMLASFLTPMPSGGISAYVNQTWLFQNFSFWNKPKN